MNFSRRYKTWSINILDGMLKVWLTILIFAFTVAAQKFKPTLAYGVQIPERIGPREGISYVRLQPLYDALGLGDA